MRPPWSEKRNIPVLEAPKGRRDEFVEPYFRGAKPDEVVAVLKAREPARIMIAIGDRAADRWHLQFAERWVVQYNFYLNDERWASAIAESDRQRHAACSGSPGITAGRCRETRPPFPAAETAGSIR
jgi:hypothetical protein